MLLRNFVVPILLYEKPPFMQFNLVCISSSIYFRFLLGSKPFSAQRKEYQHQLRQFSRWTILNCHEKCSCIADASTNKAFYSSDQNQFINSSILNDLMHTKMKEGELSTLRLRKQILRKEVRALLKSDFSVNDASKLLQQSNLVFSRLFDLPQYQSAKTIGVFLSMPSGEIQTRDAIRKILRDGKVLFVPRVGLDFEKCDMDMVRAVIPPSTESDEKQLFYDCWPKNKWNIPEPPMKKESSGNALSLIAQPGDIDLLLVPGLAFDSNGHRLGQGKGYYDRFISKMRCTADENKPEERKPLLVGVCFDQQYLDADGFTGIPVTDHDCIMDLVITPTKTLTVART